MGRERDRVKGSEGISSALERNAESLSRRATFVVVHLFSHVFTPLSSHDIVSRMTEGNGDSHCCGMEGLWRFSERHDDNVCCVGSVLPPLSTRNQGELSVLPREKGRKS